MRQSANEIETWSMAKLQLRLMIVSQLIERENEVPPDLRGEER